MRLNKDMQSGNEKISNDFLWSNHVRDFNQQYDGKINISAYGATIQVHIQAPFLGDIIENKNCSILNSALGKILLNHTKYAKELERFCIWVLHPVDTVDTVDIGMNQSPPSPFVRFPEECVNHIRELIDKDITFDRFIELSNHPEFSESIEAMNSIVRERHGKNSLNPLSTSTAALFGSSSQQQASAASGESKKVLKPG